MIYSGRKTFAGTPSYSIPAGLADRLFCESGRGQESNREVFDEEMLALDAPAMCLKMRVDRWNSGGESFFRRDKDDVDVVGGERFYIVDRGQRAA